MYALVFEKGELSEEQRADLKRKKKHFAATAVVLEKELKDTTGDCFIVFVKVHVPFSVLMKEAELAHLKMKLKTSVSRSQRDSKTSQTSKIFLNNLIRGGVDQVTRHLKYAPTHLLICVRVCVRVRVRVRVRPPVTFLRAHFLNKPITFAYNPHSHVQLMALQAGAQGRPRCVPSRVYGEEQALL